MEDSSPVTETNNQESAVKRVEIVGKSCRRCNKPKGYLQGRRRTCNICLKKNVSEYNKKYLESYTRKPLTDEQRDANWLRSIKYSRLNYPCAVNRRERTKKLMREKWRNLKKGTEEYSEHLRYKNEKRREVRKLRKLGIYRDRRYLTNKVFAKNPLAFREIVTRYTTQSRELSTVKGDPSPLKE